MMTRGENHKSATGSPTKGHFPPRAWGQKRVVAPVSAQYKEPSLDPIIFLTPEIPLTQPLVGQGADQALSWFISSLLFKDDFIQILGFVSCKPFDGAKSAGQSGTI